MNEEELRGRRAEGGRIEVRKLGEGMTTGEKAGRRENEGRDGWSRFII
jgi:hypothetical protein